MGLNRKAKAYKILLGQNTPEHSQNTKEKLEKRIVVSKV